MFKRTRVKALLIFTFLFAIHLVNPPHARADEICKSEGINTALGCIPVGNAKDFSQFLLSWGLGIGGGIAFVLIVYAGFMIMTGSGNPKRIEAGKELLTSAVSGLLLIIFSVFIIRLLGVDILGIKELK